MKIAALICGLMFSGLLQAQAADTLPPPGFHHLHLNSVDPSAAIVFYMRQFPSTTKRLSPGFPH
jgi:hypothetical protein